MVKVTILLEVQGTTIYCWVNSDCIKTWKRKYTGLAGAPLELARNLEKAFSVAHVPVQIEFGEGFEDIEEL
jgi:hypothetical protein